MEAVNNPNALEMDTWHTCDTTHCRAGWAVVLAGKEGKDLESKTSSLFAGMVIFNKSSDIKFPLHKFFDNNKDAMDDIKRCAELEKSKL